MEASSVGLLSLPENFFFLTMHSCTHSLSFLTYFRSKSVKHLVRQVNPLPSQVRLHVCVFVCQTLRLSPHSTGPCVSLSLRLSGVLFWFSSGTCKQNGDKKVEFPLDSSRGKHWEMCDSSINRNHVTGIFFYLFIFLQGYFHCFLVSLLVYREVTRAKAARARRLSQKGMHN